MNLENTKKIYVEVYAHYDTEGNIKPMYIRWTNDKVYPVEPKGLPVPRAAEIAGGAGMRYTLKQNGRVSYLFLEHGTNRWFVEKR